jgi:hypothetical protein
MNICQENMNIKVQKREQNMNICQETKREQIKEKNLQLARRCRMTKHFYKEERSPVNLEVSASLASRIPLATS